MTMRLQPFGNSTFQCLLYVALLVTMGGCSPSDDVIDIFTGKRWKMTFIALEGNYKQYDFWNRDDDARTASMKLLASDNTFVLTFEGASLNGVVNGGIGGKGVLATLGADSHWSVTEGSRAITLSVSFTGSETDALAKAFVNGLQHCFRYEGDNDNLYLYYHSGQNVMFMAFKPQRK
ncbi:MAG: DUF4847 domain-containing protein [Prevotellaceae bacterium]|jgi:hypothetical protein|nr:DUF4847 domain-containing protein [Prevotellaceae bacterium]